MIDYHFMLNLSYDIASGSEIMPCNKIAKPQVFSGIFGKRYDIHNNVVYIMAKL